MNKSLSEYDEAISNCLIKKGYYVLFYGEKNYFNDVIYLLENNKVGFELNKTKRTIRFENGSVMFFIRKIEPYNLHAMEFNMIFISETEPMKEHILERQRLPK